MEKAQEFYPFDITGFIINEFHSAGPEASCIGCGWLDRFSRMCAPEVMEESLAAHRSNCKSFAAAA